MSDTPCTWITPEEAVARMLNLNYIPAGCTLSDMMAAFLEVAEVDYHNARVDGAPPRDKQYLARRVEICRARGEFAQIVLAALSDELAKGAASSSIEVSEDASVVPQVSLQSVTAWAFESFGITIPVEDAVDDAGTNADWANVTIRLLSDHRISFSTGDGRYKTKRYEAIGLLNVKKRTREANQAGAFLAVLAQAEKTPGTAVRQNKYKQTMSRLRCALYRLTRVKGDPFYPFNERDGWTPKFRLVDATGDADLRAKKEAVHVPYNDDLDGTTDEGDADNE